MTFRELLENHKSYSKDRMKERNFDSSETLVYVTPWNNHGYGELILRKKILSLIQFDYFLISISTLQILQNGFINLPWFRLFGSSLKRILVVSL